MCILERVVTTPEAAFFFPASLLRAVQKISDVHSRNFAIQPFACIKQYSNRIIILIHQLILQTVFRVSRISQFY